VDAAGRPLETRLVGAHLPGRGFIGFWVYPYFPQGASGCATLLHRIFNSVLRKDGKLPRILLLHMDNTCKENKNNLVIKYLAFLVHHNVFDEVRILFLLVGHTHSIIDQRFSVISRALREQDAYTLDQLGALVEVLELGFKKEDNRYYYIKQAMDWSWLLDDTVSYKFKGFQTLNLDGVKHAIHSIRLRKDRSGQVVFSYKEHDRPGPWQGHFETRAPLPVFKEVPNPPAALKVLPRQRLRKLPLIREKVSATFKAVNPEPAGTSQGSSQGSSQGDFRDFRLLLQQKVDGAEQWWENFFKGEDEWWADKAGLDEAEQAVDTGDADLRSWLPTKSDGTAFTQPTDNRGKKAALAAFKAWDKDMPEPAGLNLGEDFRWVGRYGVEGDLPQIQPQYNPSTEVSEGDVVLMVLEKAGSTLDRGWDLAYVRSVTEVQVTGTQQPHRVFTGVYLRPEIPGRKSATGQEEADWPTGWEERPLTEFTQKEMRNGRRVPIIWDFAATDIDAIVWGCTPGKRSVDSRYILTPTAQKGLLKAISHIERSPWGSQGAGEGRQQRREQRRQEAAQMASLAEEVRRVVGEAGQDEECD